MYGNNTSLFSCSPITVILDWFVEKPITQAALKGVLIKEEDVERRPKKVTIMQYWTKMLISTSP